MKLILTFALLSIMSWTVKAEEASPDHMVEFCTAVIKVAQDTNGYEAWITTFEPDMAQVLYFQNVLQIQLDTKHISGAEVLQAAAQCEIARLELID